jgi:ParB family chromosome partitioning protein
MPKRTGLGRGLDSLIVGGDQSALSQDRPSKGDVIEVPIDRIVPNPRQPRARFDETENSELANSIQEHGILQPLILSVGDDPAEYVLVAGERRLIAARLAGLTTVPAIIRDVSDQSRLEIALIENIQRTDLSPLEAAEAFRQLSQDFELSHEEIATHIGKSRAAVSNTLRLLKLPQAVQEALSDGRISEGHARVLLSLPTRKAQIAALKTIVDQELNVRQTEELVRKLCGVRLQKQVKTQKSPDILNLEERLRNSLGTKVILNQRGKGGTLVIHFYSDEELESILDLILG